MTVPPLGHHLMTWQGWLQKQKQPFALAQVLPEVRAAGYRDIEMGGDERSLGPAKDLQRLLADQGVRIAAWSGGITYNPWPPATEDFRRSIDYAAALGVRTIVICGGFMPFPRRTTHARDYRLFGENYAAHAELARAHQQQLLFHPHRGCIVETLAEIDQLVRFVPDLQLCIDTGHLLAVGEDPLVVLDAHAARVGSLHLKDFAPEQEQFTELGEGILDLRGIVGWIRRRRFQGPCIVERDDPPQPALASAQRSRAAWDAALAA